MASKFQHLNVPDQWHNYWSKYPNGYTILEALLNWVKSVDDMSDNLNDINTRLDDFLAQFGVELGQEVAELVQQWLEDGTLEQVLEHNLFVFDNTTVKKIYVDGTNGNDSNDGTETTPYKTVLKAVNHLKDLSDIAVDGKWEVHLKGTFTQATKIEGLPKFRHPLKFIGEVDASGVPATLFNGATATGDIALWFEPLQDLRVEVYNCKFENWTNGFNGYGILGKGHGDLYVYNCRAKNCDIGFAAINNCVYDFERCWSEDCTTSGFRASYNCSGKFGSQSGTTQNACYVINCPQGFYVTRNSIAHVDYCVIDGCSYSGVLIDHASRAHVVGNDIKNNAYGVRAEGAGEWINNDNIWTNNVVNYEHFGVARETRMHSQRTKNELKFYSTLETKVHTGTIENTVVYALPSTVAIPPRFFEPEGAKLKFRVFGVISGASPTDKTIAVYSVDSNGSASYNMGSVTTPDDYGTFIYEFEMFAFGANNQKATNLLNVDGSPSRTTFANRSMTTDIERRFRIYCQLADASATVTFEGVEVYLQG